MLIKWQRPDFPGVTETFKYMEGLSEGLAFGTGCKHFLLGPQPLTSFLFGKEGQERWEGGKIGEKLANSTSEILIMVFALARHGVSREVPCSALKGETHTHSHTIFPGSSGFASLLYGQN